MSTEKRGGRRDAIIEAAYSCMAKGGYDRTSTAQICAAAGVSSGTFFHYFPTKADVLVAILESGLEHTREVFARIRARATPDAQGALELWCEHVLQEASDDDLAGFDSVLGAVPDHPGVAAALKTEGALVHDLLTDLIALGQAQETMRTDLAPARVATWLAILANGLLGHAADEGSIQINELRPEFVDIVGQLVRPRQPTPGCARSVNSTISGRCRRPLGE